MNELPSGTVTLLFTDIEGSTRLLHELGAGYRDALDEHRRVIREALEAHGGVEVDRRATLSSSPSRARGRGRRGAGGAAGARVRSHPSPDWDSHLRAGAG
jgi:class 3 adenylate cyclase